MVAVGVAISVNEFRGWDSVSHHQLRRRGVVYGQPEDLDVLQLVTVGEVMSESDTTVRQDLSASALRARFQASGTHGDVVVDDQQRLVGVVSRSDLDREGATAGELCTRRVVTATPSDPVFRAVRRMASLDVGRIPVIDATDRRVVVVLRRADIVHPYQRGISRSLGAQQGAAVGRLRDLAGVGFVEVVVDDSAQIVGQQVKDIAWPTRSILTSVRRGGEVVVPTGTTRIESGDELVVPPDTPRRSRRSPRRRRRTDRR